MWTRLVRIILRQRLLNLIVLGLLTLFMGYHATTVKLSYEMKSVLPTDDPTSIDYREFRQTFGEDGSVYFIGIRDPRIFSLEHFNAWYDLMEDLRAMDGVEQVVCINNVYNLARNDSTRRFDFHKVVNIRPESQQEVDSIRRVLFSLPFYEGLLFNKESQATLMMVTLDKQMLNTRERIPLVYAIRDRAQQFSEQSGVQVHHSGLPYIRTMTSKKVQDELQFFMLLAMIVASALLLAFFRSFKAMVFPMVIVLISVIWAFGIIGLLGYEITLLTGIIPPLLIIIGVENCIFLLNKYHHEFRAHGNKVKALSRVVQRVGNATLLTNLTTAVGFATFIVTGNPILVEFGVVASINIMIVFLLSIFLIPIFYSYLDPPEARHTRHLSSKLTVYLVEKVVHLVKYRRNWIYGTSVVAVVLGFVGITMLRTTGNVVDDIPHKDPLYQDLLFFEKEFKGTLPFEIMIDTRKARGVQSLAVLKRMDRLQDTLMTYPEFSRPLSITELVKFGRQAFYLGDPDSYSLPSSNEMNFMAPYLPKVETGRRSLLQNFVDSSLQVARISVQMANIGTNDIERIHDDLRPKVDSIFSPEKYDVRITGTSLVFLRGNEYLVHNLMTSLLLAIVVILLIMSLLFTSYKMVGLSMIPNLLPQLLTAALMGFAAIPIKPSTILIFSIALGISVDNAIHFLSRYRIELRYNNWQIRKSVLLALRETSYGMVYSSIVLFFGFAMFTLSSFGGTEAMGFLVSFTLLVAVLSNLLLLPSLLLTLDKRATTRSFKEPMLEILDEELDIELTDLELEPTDTRGSA
ncbi:MAG TPA: MMPL family transporter [Bacteroidales bacterium]|nr:MMPL family transporter [Bacteroidales bacterium]